MGPKHWLREQEFQKTHTSRAKPFYRKLNSMRCGNNFSSDVYKFLKCGTGTHRLHVDAMWHILSLSLCAHVCLTEDTFCARGTRVNHFITKTLSKVVWSCKSQHHCFIFCTFYVCRRCLRRHSWAIANCNDFQKVVVFSCTYCLTWVVLLQLFSNFFLPENKRK